MGKSVQAVGAGELQVSVVEGRNFAVKEMGRGTLDSCVELLLGDEKVPCQVCCFLHPSLRHSTVVVWKDGLLATIGTFSFTTTAIFFLHLVIHGALLL